MRLKLSILKGLYYINCILEKKYQKQPILNSDVGFFLTPPSLIAKHIEKLPTPPPLKNPTFFMDAPNVKFKTRMTNQKIKFYGKVKKARCIRILHYENKFTKTFRPTDILHIFTKFQFGKSFLFFHWYANNKIIMYQLKQNSPVVT